jgi:intracellular septation protein
MAEKQINPGVKAALEFGPLVLFLIAFFLLKDRHLAIGGTDYKGIILVTGAFVVVMIAATGLLWFLSGELSNMQVFSLVTVIAMGGLTVVLNDERYLKMKPTLYYLTCAALLGIGLLQGKSYLKSMIGSILPLNDDGWMLLTRRFMLFFLALAAVNEVVWRNFSTETWVLFKVIGLIGLTVVFMACHARFIERYAAPPEDRS